ncbi:MAG: sulfotransferase family 2 domain-containing protein, partial [Proteobacteria bacterium]|nr:sulfotransferase family 2 domain-containing protein [Pseudomonadota bacterium]
YNFLFVHIAKTGGTSVRAALNRLRWRDPLFPAQFIASRLSHMTGHRIASKLPRHARIIAAKEMLPRELFDRLFKFAFVRNPWDLQVSSWHHLRRERPHLLKDIPDFPSFIRWKLDPSRPYQYHIDTSIERQVDYLKDLDGTILVDFIGKYENLQEDYEEACRRIGITPPTLPHKRQAKGRTAYSDYYDEETRKLVGDFFREDIETFGYGFDQPIPEENGE